MEVWGERETDASRRMWSEGNNAVGEDRIISKYRRGEEE